MKKNRLINVAVASSFRLGFGLCFGLACISSHAALRSGELSLVDAHRAYYQGEFELSLNAYERLAKAGSAEAAERAGFMLLQANGYFGRQVRRDVGRAVPLLEQAARDDRAGAAFLLNMLPGAD
jgi:TPR repeat protein